MIWSRRGPHAPSTRRALLELVPHVGQRLGERPPMHGGSPADTRSRSDPATPVLHSLSRMLLHPLPSTMARNRAHSVSRSRVCSASVPGGTATGSPPLPDAGPVRPRATRLRAAQPRPRPRCTGRSPRRGRTPASRTVPHQRPAVGHELGHGLVLLVFLAVVVDRDGHVEDVHSRVDRDKHQVSPYVSCSPMYSQSTASTMSRSKGNPMSPRLSPRLDVVGERVPELVAGERRLVVEQALVPAVDHPPDERGSIRLGPFRHVRQRRADPILLVSRQVEHQRVRFGVGVALPQVDLRAGSSGPASQSRTYRDSCPIWGVCTYPDMTLLSFCWCRRMRPPPGPRGTLVVTGTQRPPA